MRTLIHYRSLVRQLILRDLTARYKNSVLGVLWLFAQPLIQLAVYSFVFQVVLRARWDVTTPAGATVPFGVVLFVGLLMNTLIAEALTRGPALVTSNVTFVKRVIFPLEALSLVSIASCLVSVLVGMVLLTAITLALVGPLPIEGLLAIVPILLLALMALGICWLMAGLGVYVPDLIQFTPHLATIMLFTAPILYDISLVPQAYRWISIVNPLSVPVENARSLLFQGVADWGRLGIYGVCALLVAWLGGLAFRRMRGGFADVL